MEARQLLAIAVDDWGIAVAESTATVIESSSLTINDDTTPTAGAVLVYDANLESDLTWTNTGIEAGFNANLGTPTLINSDMGLSTQLAAIKQAYRFDGNGGGTFANYQTLPGDPTDNDAT